MNPEPRFYRTGMGKSRFESFEINYKDSNLWIGIDKKSFNKHIPFFALKKLTEIREILEDYIQREPEFKSSLIPVKLLPNAPEIALNMAEASKKASTGPMAAVAGAFAEYIGRSICEEFILKEIVVENGGDIWMNIESNILISVYAGNSPFSEKISVEVKASFSPLSICTSAGKVGPSLSFGCADAVMVACKDAALADALATAIGNKIKQAADIEIQQNDYKNFNEILSLIIVCEDKIGVSGKFKIKPSNQ